MSAERADNYKVLQNMKRKDPKTAITIKEIVSKILEFAREDGTPIKSAIVIIDEDMTEEEKEMALFEGFLKEGYSPEEADKKVREWMKIEKELFKEESLNERLKNANIEHNRDV
ncbi:MULTISPECIES: hypothetical protein [Thermodesulfovibrio]|jgi:predicted RNase H-like HicB family nuclease|uniref:hypothetical protein n=1 Tax=Thermodesulfovibrio TaxID=28261 RepID=UPI0004252B72|nr:MULTISPECIES: hypothetical protein [Thermodesulfovibrio]